MNNNSCEPSTNSSYGVMFDRYIIDELQRLFLAKDDYDDFTEWLPKTRFFKEIQQAIEDSKKVPEIEEHNKVLRFRISDRVIEIQNLSHTIETLSKDNQNLEQQIKHLEHPSPGLELLKESQTLWQNSGVITC